MSCFYFAMYLSEGYYAMTGVYVYYFLAAIYGLWVWKRKKEKENEQENLLKHVNLKLTVVILAVIALLTFLLAQVLKQLGSEGNLWMDAATAACNIVGMWMIAKKYVEHWLLWIVVDVLAASMLFIMGRPLSSALFAFYAVVSVFGYINWVKKIGKSH